MKFSLIRFCFPFSFQFPFRISNNNNMDVDSARFDPHLHHDDEETVSDSFVCCVCLDLLYKPIVLECGHVSCFWCVHKSMDPGHVSHCPICRNPYHYFPTICEMLHFLLIKMYPIAYRIREDQMLEEEKKTGFFSPQLGGIDGSNSSRGDNGLSDLPSISCTVKEDKDCLQPCVEGSTAVKDNNQTANSQSCKSVSRADLLCPACKLLLFCPAVLNCGHVFCQPCIVVPEDGVIICKVCEVPHPSECPNVCLELKNFLEGQFPDEYAARKENNKKTKSRFLHKNPSSDCSSNKSTKKGFRALKSDEDILPWWKEYGSKLHYGAGCDYCGMYPIVGERYRCKDCVEDIGFDLCGDCYKTSSKRPGRFNQQHTSDHRLELVKPLDLSAGLMFRLVGGHIVDSSGDLLLPIGALEDPSDTWVTVDSAEGSVPSELIDASETSGENVDPIARHDNDMEEENSPSTA